MRLRMGRGKEKPQNTRGDRNREASAGSILRLTSRVRLRTWTHCSAKDRVVDGNSAGTRLGAVRSGAPMGGGGLSRSCVHRGEPKWQKTSPIISTRAARFARVPTLLEQATTEAPE